MKKRNVAATLIIGMALQGWGVELELDMIRNQDGLAVFENFSGKPDELGVLGHYSLQLPAYDRGVYFQGGWWPSGGNRVYSRVIQPQADGTINISEVHDKVVVTDYREVENAPVGNRFLIYTTFPDCNVSLRIQWGPGKKLVALNMGHSIFDRSCTVDVGELCRNYGGGGHRGAGGCVLRPMAAGLAIKIVTEKLRKN